MGNEKQPLILITNDDGYQAGGIKALAGVARDYGQVVVCAPLTMQSGKSNAVTVYDPLRALPVSQEPGMTVLAVNGTPTDCVKLALGDLLDGRTPTLVLSGINHGFNLGTNTLYSGTMGAAFEAAIHHLPAVALSYGCYDPDADFTQCLPIVRQMIELALAKGLPKDVCLNVNIPKVDEIKGIKVTTTAMGYWVGEYERRVDPHQMPYYWAAGSYAPDDPADESTDVWATNHGYVAVTPCRADQTARQDLVAIGEMLR